MLIIVTGKLLILLGQLDPPKLLTDLLRELGRIDVGPLELLLEPPDVGEHGADEEEWLAYASILGGHPDDLERAEAERDREPSLGDCIASDGVS